MDEIIVVDKPASWTSHDVVAFYRKKLGVPKIGHAGTLDPFATGVLVLLLGEATKRFDEFKPFDKEYELTVEFGWATDTGDPEGQVLQKLSSSEVATAKLNRDKIAVALESFRGEYQQTVPAFSAAKLRGKPLYKYARQGVAVKLPQKTVMIKEIELLEFNKEKAYPRVKIRVVCSSGTYMRALAQDIGQKLGLPAVAVALRRTRVGEYALAGAVIPATAG